MTFFLSHPVQANHLYYISNIDQNQRMTRKALRTNHKVSKHGKLTTFLIKYFFMLHLSIYGYYGGGNR